MRLAWFFMALISSGVLALVHTVASEQYLYWTYRWLDTPVHILGGFALGSLLIAFLFRYRPLYFVAGMLIVGVGWEVFEVLLGLPRPPDYLLDTAQDLVNDTLGAGLAFVLARYTLWRSV